MLTFCAGVAEGLLTTKITNKITLKMIFGIFILLLVLYVDNNGDCLVITTGQALESDLAPGSLNGEFNRPPRLHRHEVNKTRVQDTIFPVV
jgi:hypothetical protein